MAGRPSAPTEKAMKLVRAGMNGADAAKKVGIALSTIYRSPLWKAYKAELQAKRTGETP